jgi:hypothetical protein
MKEAPKQLAAVSVNSIRKYRRLSLRYLDAYRRGIVAVFACTMHDEQRVMFIICSYVNVGLKGRLAAYAVKKYRGHRCLPSNWEKELAVSFEQTYQQRHDDPENYTKLNEPAIAQVDASNGPQETQRWAQCEAKNGSTACRKWSKITADIFMRLDSCQFFCHVVEGGDCDNDCDGCLQSECKCSDDE